MIRPSGFAGAAFGTIATGDLRVDRVRRRYVAQELGIPADWAFVKQIHSAVVVEATRSGNLGEADAIVTAARIPIAVATADCVPIIIEAAAAVAVVHAGWRGAAAGVVPATLAFMQASGHAPLRAAIGPAIGPCCYEVGAEVSARFPGFVRETTWGSSSVDIPGYVADQLAGLEVWRSADCTFTSEGLNSWRSDRTKQRQVAVAWLPKS
jgi:YfiH family protein